MRAAQFRVWLVASLALAALCATSVATAASTVATGPPILTVQVHIRVSTKAGEVPTTFNGAPFALSKRLVTFSPDLVNVGTVKVEITNSDLYSHVLEVNGVSSHLIGPGGRSFIRVTFKRPGVYNVTINSDNNTYFSGSLKVIR